MYFFPNNPIMLWEKEWSGVDNILKYLSMNKMYQLQKQSIPDPISSLFWAYFKAIFVPFFLLIF